MQTRNMETPGYNESADSKEFTVGVIATSIHVTRTLNQQCHRWHVSSRVRRDVDLSLQGARRKLRSVAAAQGLWGFGFWSIPSIGDLVLEHPLVKWL